MRLGEKINKAITPVILMQYYILALIFVLSFISNATPFFGAPYTVIASTLLIQEGVNPYNFLEVVIVSGIGSAIAKSVMYMIGYGLGSALKNNKNVKFFHQSIKGRSFYLVLFLTAILPFFPFDDFVFLVGGAGKASIIKMLEITIFSKILKSSMEIGIEVTGLIQISRLTDIPSVELGIISSILFAILGFLLFKIDWEKMYKRVERYFNVSDRNST
ncbi:MAG: hypothetical protein QXI65_02090 [Metallosphaera sp.]